MARYARQIAPGTLVHFIARFINGEYRLAGDEERAGYLSRLESALVLAADWTVLAFALMSNHIHLALLAGTTPLERLSKSLHVGVASYLRNLQGTLGPVFSERPKTIEVPLAHAALLLAYIHNNPVRATVVGAADDTDWTSHRALVGAAPRPRWLASDTALELCGFNGSPSGRRDFANFVAHRGGDPRSPTLSGDHLAQRRAMVRVATSLPAEISSPRLRVAEQELVGEHVIGYRGPVPVAPRWHGDLALVVDAASEQLGLSVEAIRSRSRLRPVTRARRVVATAGVLLLRRRTSEMAAELAISDAAVSHYLRQADGVMPLAQRVAAQLRQQTIDTSQRVSLVS